MRPFLTALFVLALAADARGQTPADALVLELDRIESAYLEARYDDVVAQATRLLDHAPQADDARFLRGAAYWQLAAYASARRDLAEYAAGGGDFAAEARALLDAMQRLPAPSPGPEPLRFGWWIGALASDRVVNPDLPIDDPDRESQDAGARFGWRLAAPLAGPWWLEYRGSHLHYFNVPEASWHNESLEAVGAWMTPGRRGSLEWRAGGEFVRRHDGPDVWRLRTRAEAAWAVTASHVGWCALEAAYDDYPYDADFNGPPLLAALGFDHALGRATLFWEAYVLSHNAKNDALSFTETGGRLGLSAPLTPALSAGVSARTLAAEFDRYERIFESDRSDDYRTADAWMSLRLNARWRLTAFAEYTENDSNFEDVGFERTRFGLDLIYGVL